MYLQKITISNFKNISQAQIDFSKSINCIIGNNGQGKTNLLDAVYYLSMTKSYFDTTDRFSFRHGEQNASVQGAYFCEDGSQETITIVLDSNSAKQVRRGKKAYDRFSDHVGLIPIVMSSPTDTALINDSSAERRKFVDIFLSQTDNTYLKSLQSYNQLLLQRNKLLKQECIITDLLNTISGLMTNYANYIYNKRIALCSALAPLVSHYYNLLSLEKETVNLDYISDLHNGPLDELLLKEADKERVLKYTTVGIHRDDFAFSLDEYPLRKCGSQGQQKSFLVALKLAQFSIMRDSYGFAPILLLDDVFDKLDSERVNQLMQIVASEGFSQIFITDSNKVRLECIVKNITNDCAIFEVENGIYTMIEK
ncbi:MAG: DNA replication and repair protein RecF [Bacteroidales bacterium]|nr:DNA replication and repair protein RecF [Bacteroidales bacterium]